MVLPVFGFVCRHEPPLVQAITAEGQWLQRCATTGRATAHLWHAPQGWVVPRRYTLAPGWGRPLPGELQLRSSGGGLVPQGPGIWNLSLVFPAPPQGPSAHAGIYAAFCAELAAALLRLDIVATPQAVQGSFCDGRYNLAVGGRKVAGTAQAWRRIDGRSVVLVHAVLIVEADPEGLTAGANAIEQTLGNPQRYRAEALTSLAREAADPSDIEQRVLTAIAERFARRVLPDDRG